MMNIKDFGAKGDGQTDDSPVICRAISEVDGFLFFPRGNYLLTRPIEIELSSNGRMGIYGGGVAKLIMAGPGPAIRLVGTHKGTADPDTVSEVVWQKERMPTVNGLEIMGAHPEADGIELEYTMAALLSHLFIHRCRHGVHFIKRNRNPIISSCHIYHNNGCGVYFEGVNLHQVNIADSHISYNAGSGIKVFNSEIRNLQICGNDIEYNYNLEAEESADIWIDTQEGSIREGAIVGNTIQASPSPGGANIRMLGQSKDIAHKVGLFSISGNLISSQKTNIHLKYNRGITISGNTFFSGHKHSIHAEYSSNIIVGPNIFDHNPDYSKDTLDGLLFENCSGCTFSGFHFADTKAEAVVLLRDCSEVNMTGCQILNPQNIGVFLENGCNCRVSNCIILDSRKPKIMQEAIKVVGGNNNRISDNLTDAENRKE
ncbi:right-handed parallel beta-helix repeat-containing protein [bacterium]|nr:right-handed parallel beta-helix repeat-containing protein [bacterium]